MKFFISLGVFDLKYFLYLVLYAISDICIYAFIYNDYENNENKNIINKQLLLDSLCLFVGYLLNFIPGWLSNKSSKSKKKSLIIKEKEKEDTQPFKYIYNNPYEKYLSKKYIAIILFTCILLLLKEFINIVSIKLDENSNLYNIYEDKFNFIQYLIIYIFSKFSTQGYYKHQNFSFLIFTLVEFIKIIYFLIMKISKDISIITSITIIIINIIIIILGAVYILSVKEIMKNNFISPYKCNYIIGIINTPLIIAIYLIISLTPLGKEDNYYYCGNILTLFKSNIDIINAIRLVSLTLFYGLIMLLVNKTIYDFTIYHLYIPLLVEDFIMDIIRIFSEEEDLFELIFLISCFSIEFIMILVFLEIIEVNFCNLNKNLKRNIELRAINDYSLSTEDDNDDEINNEMNNNNN